MIKRIHHVGIAVPDLDTGANTWGEDGLGLVEEGREDVASARTRVLFLPVGESRIELLEPMGDDTPVAKHLARRGPGMHHICLEVDDVKAEMERMRAQGMRFTSDEPTPGAHGARVAFLHPKDTGGVLIELNQFAASPDP